jgi:hypothetical protein
MTCMALGSRRRVGWYGRGMGGAGTGWAQWPVARPGGVEMGAGCGLRAAGPGGMRQSVRGYVGRFAAPPARSWRYVWAESGTARYGEV